MGKTGINIIILPSPEKIVSDMKPQTYRLCGILVTCGTSEAVHIVNKKTFRKL